MKRTEAERLSIRTIADLAACRTHVSSIAGDYEFSGGRNGAPVARQLWPPFRERALDAAEFMYPAVGSEVDVISAYTSDGRIAQYDLVVLEDPKHVIRPYDAVLLLSPNRAKDSSCLTR